MKIAVLLTCYNRKQKTERCLDSLLPVVGNIPDHQFDIYLTDDDSEDGTEALVREKYPKIHLIKGKGNLFWAGGMRCAWETALHIEKNYDGFLLINDDVVLDASFWKKIEETMQYAKCTYSQQGIYVSSTKDEVTDRFTYGGHKLRKKLFKHSFYSIEPTDKPQECQLTNANILYVAKNVVDAIGILDTLFTHSLADFDYSLTAWEKRIPVLVCSGYGGYCSNDHPENVLAPTFSLKERVNHLYNIKNLALKEYLYYLKKHFWWKAPYAFLILWGKALFPRLIK
jgi:GT2 family glycosyltransferase